MDLLSFKKKTSQLLWLIVSVALFLSALVIFSGFRSVNASSTNTDLEVTINSVLDLSVATCNSSDNSLVAVDVEPSSAGTFKSNCQTVNVSTNAPGYTLTAKASGSNVNYNSGAITNNLLYLNPTTIIPTPNIKTTTNTIAAPGLLAVDSWGFAAESRLNFDNTYAINNASNKYASLPTTDTTIYSTDEFPLPETNHTFYYASKITPATMAGAYATTITYTAIPAEVPPPTESFKFTIDTRMTDTPFADTDTPATNPAHFAGTATEFIIPTTGRVSGAYPDYDWVINCGGGQSDRVVAGHGGPFSSETVLCNYSTPGEYQITIKSNGEATPGWMNAFGFYADADTGPNVPANRLLFKSIDTPFTNNMRFNTINPNSMSYRFAYMFSRLPNATSIPANLFSEIDTSNAIDLSNMFRFTFYFYGTNSTTATIPAGLFDSIDTSNATDLSLMFSYTFAYYAYYNPMAIGTNSTTATIPAGLFDSIDTSSATYLNSMFLGTFSHYANTSTTATIPAGLFDSIDTSNATDLKYMFYEAFANCAGNSTTATIPAGLFDSIDTSNATDLKYMFYQAFDHYAYNSTTATIPAGLFDSIDTSNATDLRSMFHSTFAFYAYNSTTATIPAGLFDSIDTSNATDLNSMFDQTFHYYAYSNKVSDSTPNTDINEIWGNANFAGKITSNEISNEKCITGYGDLDLGTFCRTFNSMPSLVGSAQTFINNKLGGVIPTNRAHTFAGTGVSDLSTLHANWK